MNAAFAVNQYALSGCQFNASGNALKWKDNTSRPSYSTPAVASANAWSATTTHLTLTLVTSGANVDAQDGNFGAVWRGLTFDGMTESTCAGGYFTTTSNSWWNRYYTDAYSAAKRQSLMVHELGHGLGLDHYTAATCPNRQIMQPDTYSRFDLCGYKVPQNGDHDGINALY